MPRQAGPSFFYGKPLPAGMTPALAEKLEHLICDYVEEAAGASDRELMLPYEFGIRLFSEISGSLRSDATVGEKVSPDQARPTVLNAALRFLWIAQRCGAHVLDDPKRMSEVLGRDVLTGLDREAFEEARRRVKSGLEPAT